MVDKLVRILYVEDEPDIQMVARLALEALGGYTVAICSSGDEALQLAPGFQPQLFLLDVMMPGMNGPSTLKILRALPQFARTPVIFMTAKVQPGEVAGYKELGVIDVIPKPFNPMKLASRVQEIWERYHD
ncbi:Response regulator receiver domain-containing protein [Candidatus Nitrotoga sp. HW29]|uniref:response regulator n=1 Tax=Candidatus Nitrotoga sp. HW29 TaxID=2886963 RepID=UPI001EF28271|nr:response regulator [Candidatus Nitrotoga sp. HW29]CAH1906421.1 Response regulator receiver domain-containing protein [Candidatus Nitrotoga sp. HW29]